jgi:acylphosphatase
MIVARRFFVSGRVQGVGFRYFVQDHAAVEGVHGYVRNLPDGRVEALVEGEAESVLRVERAIRRGPPSARVEQVTVDDVAPAGRATGFAVR